MDEGLRRLAAVVFSDVVNYTARMAASESLGLRLRERHRELWLAAAGNSGGQLVDENGDELVLLFDSALDAVRSGLSVREEVGGDPDLELRMGVHLGDVLVRDDRAYGDAMNVASRVRAEALPGALVVTREVAQSLRNQPGLVLRALGERTLKNVPQPVAIFSVEDGEPAAAGPRASRLRRFSLRAGLGIACIVALSFAGVLLFPDATNRVAATLLVRSLGIVSGPADHEIGFTTSSDGVRIAYGSFGEGPSIVFVNTWFTHVETVPPFLVEFGDRHRVVHYDGRGFGLSQHGVSHSSAARVADLEAVVAAAGLERFSILGVSGGSPTAIAYAALHPERVERLALFGSTARMRDDDSSIQAISVLMRNHFGTERFRPFFSEYFLPDASEFERRFFDEVLKLSGAGEDVSPFWESLANEDVRELARQVRAPTFVGHVRGDHLIPLESGLEVAQLIPNTKLLIIEGSNHVVLPGESEGVRLRAALREFLRE